MPLPPIIFEDESFIAFDKPSGVPIAPVAGREGESLMPLVRARFGGHVASVHRVDAEASGLFLCAKTKPALDFLSGQFQAKTIDKKYLALVVVLPVARAFKALTFLRDATGALPDAFTVDLPLREDEKQKGRMRVGKGQGAQESVSEFRLLERFGRFAWIECRPLTGRVHQPRVHLGALGAPVLNDPLYGDLEIKLLLSELKKRYKGREEEKPLLPQLALHAGELTFRHPVSREPMTLAAPLPHEFEVALKYLRKFKQDNR